MNFLPLIIVFYFLLLIFFYQMWCDSNDLNKKYKSFKLLLFYFYFQIEIKHLKEILVEEKVTWWRASELIAGRRHQNQTRVFPRQAKWKNATSANNNDNKKMNYFISLGFEHSDRVYASKSGINYTRLFAYEKRFFDDDFVASKGEWMRQNWHTSIYYAIVYVVAIFLGQAYMKNRTRFELRGALVAWNLFLAIFSAIGSIRTWPEFISALTNQGLAHTMCSSDYAYGVSGCWGW